MRLYPQQGPHSSYASLDVFACARCGGRRGVVAYVTAASGVLAILEHLGLPTRPAKRAPAQGPPQQARCWAWRSHEQQLPAALLKQGRPRQQCAPWGCSDPYTGAAHGLAGPSRLLLRLPAPARRRASGPPFRLYLYFRGRSSRVTCRRCMPWSSHNTVWRSGMCCRRTRWSWARSAGCSNRRSPRRRRTSRRGGGRRAGRGVCGAWYVRLSESVLCRRS
jgi:hypothetical protein